MRVLELTKSTYHVSFLRLIKEVATASAEAHDNVKYLDTLKVCVRRACGRHDRALDGTIAR